MPTSLTKPLVFYPPPAGSAQLDMSDDFGMSNFGMRRLTAFYSRNFAAHFPATCFQSSYFSPFRMYFKGYNFETDRTTFIYQLDVSSCPFPKADCCRLPLDHMLVRTSESGSRPHTHASCPCPCPFLTFPICTTHAPHRLALALALTLIRPTPPAESDASVMEVRLDGRVLGHDVSERGLTIYDLAVSPTQLKSMQLEIVTPATGRQLPGNLTISMWGKREGRVCAQECASNLHNLRY